MQTLKRYLGIFAIVGIMSVSGAGVASAATGTLVCGEGTTDRITCDGTGWSVTTNVNIQPETTDACTPGAGPYDWNCMTDGAGAFSSCEVPGDMADDTYYAYGTEDDCSTSTRSSFNPIIFPTPVVIGMDSTSIAAAITTAFGTFATQFGGIIILIVGFAIGLYGVKLAYGWLTNLVRARGRKE